MRSADVSRDSVTQCHASSSAPTAKGTLKKTTQRQSIASVSRPPTNGPIAVPIAPSP